MRKNDSNDELTVSNQIPIKDIFLKLSYTVFYIKKGWKTISLLILTGLLAGLLFSVLTKPQYAAVCTFVLDENDKSGILSQYSGLASLAGIELDNNGGIFKGDNIIELYKSRSMLEKTLLSEADFNGKKENLIDHYIKFNDLLQKWKDKDNIKSIDFENNPKIFSRKQDSIIIDLADIFNEKCLAVSKPDKKLNIIKVSFVSKDELFAKNFTDKLVENVNDFYIQTKTKKMSDDIKILQHQVDSVKTALNSSIKGVASAMDVAPNANPTLNTLRVPSQKREIDVQASTAIYIELIKNLELAKIALRQQTPLIQYVDQPMLPLKFDHVSKIKGCIIGAISGCFFAILLLLTGKLYKSVKYSISE